MPRSLLEAVRVHRERALQEAKCQDGFRDLVWHRLGSATLSPFVRMELTHYTVNKPQAPMSSRAVPSEQPFLG